MKRFLLILFIAVWCVYYLQGSLYSAGSQLATISLFAGLLLSVYGWLKCYTRYPMPKMLNTMSILLLMFALYGIIMMISGTQIFRSFDRFQYTGARYITSTFSSLCPVFFAYLSTRDGILQEKHLKVLFFVFFAVCTARYLGYAYARELVGVYDTDGMTTNNLAYDFLGLLPMVCVFKKRPFVQYISILAILAFIIYSVKRGAILIGLVSVAYLILKNMSTGRKKNKLSYVFLAIVVVILSYSFIEYLMTTNSFFITRMEATMEGDSSARDEYYTFFLNYLGSLESIPKMLFGGGAYYTVVLLGNLAHNDWLEILICNGLVGAIIYLVYWVRYYKTIRLSRNTDLYLPLMLLFISMAAKTLFSMSYASTPLYASFYLGFLLATLQNNGIEQLKG